MKKITCSFLVFTSLLIFTWNAHVNAANEFNYYYSDIYVFGDSLSDNGNLKAFNQDPTLPVPQRFSNGAVLVEWLANALELEITPSFHLLPSGPMGTNYAVAGALSVDEDGDETTPDINLPTQINAFLQANSGIAPWDALYIVFIGGNDLRDARDLIIQSIFAPTPKSRKMMRQEAREIINMAVQSERDQILKLIDAGAQDILVLNAPDIGAIPETGLVTAQALFQATTKRQILEAAIIPQITTYLTKKYNRKLTRKVRKIEYRTGMDIMEFNLFQFFTTQIENGEELGFTNTEEPCVYFFSQNGAVNPKCNDAPVANGFFFWDEIHPTTKVHKNAAQSVLDNVLSNY